MKKYMLGIIAIALAVGFSAYTLPAKKKRTQSIFYFHASNSETLSNCSAVTLEFPTSQPTMSPASCSGASRVCWLGYSNFVKIGDTYYPSNDGSTQASTCDYVDDILKPAP